MVIFISLSLEVLATNEADLKARPCQSSKLFVGDGSARWAGQRNDLKVAKAGLATPAGEVRTRVVESITEFDQHVERHEQAKCIIAAGIVDERLNNYKRPALGQRIIGFADKSLFLLKVPVVQDHPHRDDIRLGQWIDEEVTADGRDAVGQTHLLNADGASAEVEPPHRCYNTFGGGFIRRNIGVQTDLAQGSDRFRHARDLACHAERVEESRLQIDASSKAKQPSQTFTGHQHEIVTRPFFEPA